MKSTKARLFTVAFLLASMPYESLADTGDPRPIYASSIFNGLGYLYAPSSTPLGNQACYFDENSAVASSTTTATELSYVHGVTSPIQAQINAITSGARTTNVVFSTFTIPTLTKDYILNVSTNSGDVYITLPDATLTNGLCVDIKNVGSNVVTYFTVNGQTIDGASSREITGLNDSDHDCAVEGNWNVY
jgi:hypothetical protein